MRIAVLASAKSWYLADLRRAAGDRHEVVGLPFEKLTALAATAAEEVAAAGTSLHDFDGVLVRTMPAGSLEQIIFRMDALARLETAGVRVVNPPKSLEAAVDKYLATAKLAGSGLLVPETIVAQTVEEGVAAFEQLGGDVVMKPLFGSEGRGIVRLEDADLARRAFQLLVQLGGVIYLQRFVPHLGSDCRLLVIGQRVLGMKRTNPLDFRTNVSRGATGEPLEVTSELGELALRAAAAVGAEIAGVDLLPGQDGQLYALEVNAVPGWQALSRVTGIDVAREVLAHLEGA